MIELDSVRAMAKKEEVSPEVVVMENYQMTVLN